MPNWKPFYPNFMLDPQKARISTLITERELKYKYFVCEKKLINGITLQYEKIYPAGITSSSCKMQKATNGPGWV